MESWALVIIGYCVVTYVLGAFICLSYLVAIDLAKRWDAIKVKGDLNKGYWPAALFWTLISPIFVPWWIATFIIAKRR